MDPIGPIIDIFSNDTSEFTKHDVDSSPAFESEIELSSDFAKNDTEFGFESGE